MSDFLACYMFHKDEPEGRVFRTQDQFDARGEGWVDSPAKLHEPHIQMEFLGSPEDIIAVGPGPEGEPEPLPPSPEKPFEYEAPFEPEIPAEDIIDPDINPFSPETVDPNKPKRGRPRKS